MSGNLTDTAIKNAKAEAKPYKLFPVSNHETSCRV